jgi:hypothetical protein
VDQVFDHGHLEVVPRAEIEGRYTGYALIPELPGDQHGPRAGLSTFHYAFGIAGLGQTVGHSFEIRNEGNVDLVLRSATAPG